MFPKKENNNRNKLNKWQNNAKQHFKGLTLKLINMKEYSELHNNGGYVIEIFLKIYILSIDGKVWTRKRLFRQTQTNPDGSASNEIIIKCPCTSPCLGGN